MKRMSTEAISKLIVFGTVAAIFLALPTAWVVRSHFEAKAWNRLTGGNATTWDAMWVELRVDCN